MSKTLLLIDASALIYRSYYALIRTPLRTSRGEETSAVFGVASALIRLLQEKKPDYIAFVLDTGKPTFRHEMYDEYKANRSAMPDELREQFPRIHEVVEAIGVPIVRMDGYEADDLIGTLALRAAENGIEAQIYSGDKDFLQLVRPGVRMVIPGKDEIVISDDSAVEKRVGVPAARVIDLMALTGDSSDNIPGVPGVGPKTALKLLKEYGTFEGVLEHADRVKGKLGERLKEHADIARLSRELVTIRTDAPVKIGIDSLERHEIDRERVAPVFQELEFHKLLEGIGRREERVEENYRLVRTEEELEKLAATLKGAGRFAFDTETTNIDPMRARLTGLSVAIAPGEAWYVPVRHMGEDNLDLSAVVQTLGPVLEDESIPKIAQNAKYDLIVLERAGMRVANVSFDPMVASYLLDPGRRQHGLDHLALIHLNHEMIPIAEVIGSGRVRTTMDHVTAESVRAYACEDADYTLRLADRLAPHVEEASLGDLLRNVEIPLIGVLQRMEMTGVAVDCDFLEKMSGDLTSEIGRMVASIHKIAGSEFNVNSPSQLQEVLFKKIGLKPLRRTKTGFSTDTSVLQELAVQHELPAMILGYRQLEKLRSTYVDALPKLVHPETNRIHTSFNQAVTATGRLSSSNPNLQNIPIRTRLGREIRRAFVAGGAGRSILSLDYSQIELRLLAHLSKDESLIRDFQEGADIHRRTAAALFGRGENEVTGEMRSRAKAVNFGIIYGMGAFGLANRLEIPRKEAKEFIDGYFATYPHVKEYLDRTIEEARANGYVETMLKRKRLLPELTSKNGRIRSFAERTAVNTPIQGSAADLIKLAMIEIHDELLRKGLEARMILQVHDELVFETPDSELEELAALAGGIMESRMELSVPLLVEAGSGGNWLEAHGLEDEA